MRSMTQEGGDMACSKLVGRQAGVIVARNVGATPHCLWLPADLANRAVWRAAGRQVC